MSNSVGRAFATLKGNFGGDPEEASKFLEGLTPGELSARNKNESSLRSRVKKRHLRVARRKEVGGQYAANFASESQS